MTWKEGRLVKAVIKSTIGGNLRLRSYNRLSLQGEGKLESAKEGTPNENSLFATQQIARPMISEKAPLKGVNLRDSYLYDYATQAGETIVVTGE